jgi:hypothetical protein
MGKLHPANAGDNEAKELVRLCRTGRLYEIENWIKDGKSLDTAAPTNGRRQRTLLEIAVETGFHSLVELIAKHEATQSAKSAALSEAVSSRRLDLVELLLANGAEIRSIPLTCLRFCTNPSERVYITARGCRTGLGVTSGL